MRESETSGNARDAVDVDRAESSFARSANDQSSGSRTGSFGSDVGRRMSDGARNSIGSSRSWQFLTSWCRCSREIHGYISVVSLILCVRVAEKSRTRRLKLGVRKIARQITREESLMGVKRTARGRGQASYSRLAVVVASSRSPSSRRHPVIVPRSSSKSARWFLLCAHVKRQAECL